MSEETHCPTCTCGRRAPVQGDPRGTGGRGRGTIAWSEHMLAWGGYAQRHGRDQSAEQLAERGGFSHGELVHYLGRQPETWRPASE